MHKILFSLAALALFAGCGRNAVSTPIYFSDHVPASKKAAPPIAKDDPLADDDAYADESGPGARNVGDFVVYRFSGSFRKQPLTLTEKVIARKGDVILVDVIAQDGANKEELFVKMSDAATNKNEVLGVSKMENTKLVPTYAGAYEELLGRATLAADRNDATLASEDVTLDVGSQKLAAKRTTFMVKVGKKTATMRTLESDSFAWGDLGGDITTTNGKTLYRAEIIDAGHADAEASPLAGELDEF